MFGKFLSQLIKYNNINTAFQTMIVMYKIKYDEKMEKIGSLILNF